MPPGASPSPKSETAKHAIPPRPASPHLAHRQLFVVVERQNHTFALRQLRNRFRQQPPHLAALALEERIVLRPCGKKRQRFHACIVDGVSFRLPNSRPESSPRSC